MAIIKQNGGYNALPISYKRTNPIPLDKSSVWYDYDQMANYAKTDKTAYVGQILSLVNSDDFTAKAYIILNVQGDLELLGNATLSSDVDDIKLQLDSIDGSIDILEQIIGSPATDEEEASGLFAELDKKANVADVYTKEETNIQINTAVAAASHLKRKKVESTDDIDINSPDADEYIYMIPSGLKDDDNKYYEYMVMDIEIGYDEDGNPITERKIEMIGSWSVDLSEYATKNELLNETNRAIEAERQLNNQIDNINSTLESVGSNLEDLESDILDLENTKVDQVYYPILDETGEIIQVPGSLLSPLDQQKLDKLSINSDGELGISGTVNASNVQGLDTWMVEESAKYIQNLTEDNLSDDLKTKINFITSVDSSAFTVENGKLILNEIPAENVTGLSELVTKVGNLKLALDGLEEKIDDEETGLHAVNQKILTLSQSLDNYVSITNFNKTVGNLDSLLASGTTLAQEVEEIKARLIWQDL